MDGREPVRRAVRREFAVTSGQRTVRLSGGVAVIGERINPTGKKKLKEAPVSYTHLDVYKRQLSGGQFDWGGRLQKSNGGAQRLAQHGRKSCKECKRRSQLDCETDGSSRYESRS